jgi:toxin ParE1/3/4
VTVRFTPSARAEFLSALAHIRRDKPAAAAAFRMQAERSLLRLEQFPESGRVLPELPDLPFRVVVVPPYRFFYRVKGKTIWVVGVWHSAQLPEEPED